uniref:THAP-type domain-containing protein n=1 Tax=Nothobranchius korthausae TaxID=1143690 RepID=A0A1A8GIW8_9TELE
MGRTCCVIGCNVRSHDRKGNKLDNGLSFHRFPSWRQGEGTIVSDITKQRRQAWIAAVRRADIEFSVIPNFLLVCSRHFHSGKPANEMYTSHPDWAPSLHLGHTEIKPTNTARYERRESRKRQKTESKPVVNETVIDDPGDLIPPVETPPPEDEPDQKPMTECDFCPLRRDEINRLLEENRALKCELSRRKLDEQFLKDDHIKVKYYTGLPHFEVLMGLLARVEPYMTQRSKILSPFQMLFLTLMRLRLNLPMQHIAHIFGVERTTASKTFSKVVTVLHAHISPLINWPGRDAMRATMPSQFVEAFGEHGVVILDCFEIFTQSQSTLTPQAPSHSHHKLGTTMKYLVSVTPQGSISFVSKGCAGYVSNKDITDSCGVLDKLLPGDLVFAGRGFDTNKVGLMCAEVKIYAFTNGQLETDVESTKKIAHLRIHVKRLFGIVSKSYAILSSEVPTHMVLPCEEEDVTFLDKVVSVCCALTNMSPSIPLK